MKNRKLSIIIMAFILSSCMVRKQKILNGDISQRSPFDFDERKLLEQGLSDKQSLMPSEVPLEAKWHDIPIPFDTIVLDASVRKDELTSEGDNGEQCIYGSLLERLLLINFFNEQMEAFGWQKEGNICSFEDMLIFSKSHKKVIISLRSTTIKKYKTIIVISLYTVIDVKRDASSHLPYVDFPTSF